MTLSKSPERYSFQLNAYLERCKEDGVEPREDYIELYKGEQVNAAQREDDLEWRKNNMEYDLRSCAWMLEKVRADDVYAQHLYAAMCNNDFQQLDTWPILKGETWSCSWRYAGGIIADMQGKGDYMNWYCSGIQESKTLSDEDLSMLTEGEQNVVKQLRAYVSESVVTDEIRQDLQKLGWAVLDKDEEVY